MTGIVPLKKQLPGDCIQGRSLFEEGVRDRGFLPIGLPSNMPNRV